MREYGQYCPVVQGSEVLGDRWTPLILREMVVLGSTRFNDIERGLPGISRTLLAQRLRHLERKGVVQIRPAASGRGHEYHLTPAGRDLEQVLSAIGEWAVRWLFSEPQPPDVDPVTLTWWLHRRVDRDRLPDARVVIELRYTGQRRAVIWMVLASDEQSVCMKHPGFEPDVVVTTDAVALQRVFSGIVTMTDALRDGSVQLEGPPVLTRTFADWFLWSPFAPLVREQLAERGAAAAAT